MNELRRPMSSSLLAWALPLSCTVLGYGLAGGIWKHSSLTAPAFCVLFALTKSLTNGLAWALAGRPNPFASPSFLRWAALGQLLNGLAWIFYFRSLSAGPAAIVQTITAAYTALAALLALVFLRERIVVVQGLGIALVIAASLMLGFDPQATSGGQGPWLRDSFLTMLFWAAAVTVIKHAYNQEGSSDSVFFLVNWAAMLATVLVYGLLNLEGWPTQGMGLGLVIVLLYCVGDLALFAAINRGPAAIVSPVSGLYPLPTVLYAALVLHERLTREQGLAIALVLAAIVLIVPEQDNPLLRLMRKERA